MRARRWIMAGMLAALTAGAAQAEDGRFTLVLKGISAGTLSWSGDGAPGGAYAVRGVLKTSGLAALLKKVRYDATAKGSITAKGTYVASSYAEDANTGKRQSKSSMTWQKGVPSVQESSEREPKPWDIDPAGQKGTVDPLTAMFATLRDVAPGQECKVNLNMFDGRRASKLILSGRAEKAGKVTCNGEYRRVAGFSPKDMSEKTRFPFTVSYEPAGGMMRVVEVAMDTIYGKARLVRD
ncbi:DUF3108 domain-containing protein [Gemmobacter serpentinus]|uniref:DUF3108 domain-containing protein n=1 Tax=Gemmobacter serpentinus TaxID=2652247 RepID=UPI001CF6AE85|nr:DUF3108 domain-containing protein [Gemmobacter serpentinus]